MSRLLLRCLALVWVLAALPAGAAFHLWQINEAYSSASGTVQFIELTAQAPGQQFLTGPPSHTLTSTSGANTKTFTFPSNLPGDTGGRRMLIGTQSFAALGVVTPDYLVPDGFLFIAGGTLNFAEGSDVWAHPALPTNGTLSLNRDGATAANSPMNFAGASGSVTPPPPPPVVLSLSSTLIDFGPQSMGTTSAARRITATNNTAGAVTVTAVSTSSAQFTQTNTCATVNPGAACNIDVTFTPATAEGAVGTTTNVMGTLTLTIQGSGAQSAELAGMAEKSLIRHYYRAILNRDPDAAGKSFWEGEATRLAARGANINEVWFMMAGYFVNSTEYVSQNKTDTQFVTDLYNTFYNRPPDPSGQGFWTDQLASGLPRDVVLFSFMFSPEFTTFTQAIFGNTAARAEVTMVMDFFRGILNRLPDTAGFDFWVSRFRTAQCAGAGAVYTEVGQMSAQFIFNPEYNNRARNNTQYVTDLYYSFLRRGGDFTGVNFWINQLNSGGKDRNTERIDFINSPEFGARVQAVIDAGCLPR